MPEHIDRRVLDDLCAGLSTGMRQRCGFDMITTEEASNLRCLSHVLMGGSR